MSLPGPALPKDRFTAVDTLAVVREIRALEHARVDKAFDLASGGVALTVRSASEGKRELAFVPGRAAAVLAVGPGHAEELSPMARELRRLLSGAILTQSIEPQGERYIELGFRRADTEEPLRLAVELFGSGNLVVVRGAKIVAVAHPRAWAHRTLRIGAEYVRPPTRGDPFALGVAGLEAALTASRTNRTSTLAARLALGGPVAEELLTRAGVEGDAPSTEEVHDVAEKVHRAFGTILADVGDHPRGYLYLRDATVVNAEPFPSQRWRAETGVVEEVRPTFSEAAWAFFSTLPALPAREKKPAAPDPRAEALRQRAQQATAVAALAQQALALVDEADTILARYGEAETTLLEARKEEDGPSRFEANVGGRVVRLFRERSVRASAQAIYEEAKRSQSKLAGARRALEESDRLLAELGDRPAAPADVAEPTVPSRRAFWFERYRWFLSTEGVLVVGGRDAGSNDLLVRRYLRPRDLYVHADIQGAPSVVVKHPAAGQPEPTGITLLEAGQFGVAFSKAWRAGLASASAFWVNADQVSKSAASGEFVARGAWVIHGTKNFLRDLPTELGIGNVPYEGAELLSVGPPEALRARGSLRFLLTPGEERDRATREVELARELGIRRDRLQSLLPSGGIAVRRA